MTLPYLTLLVFTVPQFYENMKAERVVSHILRVILFSTSTDKEARRKESRELKVG